MSRDTSLGMFRDESVVTGLCMLIRWFLGVLHARLRSCLTRVCCRARTLSPVDHMMQVRSGTFVFVAVYCRYRDNAENLVADISAGQSVQMLSVPIKFTCDAHFLRGALDSRPVHVGQRSSSSERIRISFQITTLLRYYLPRFLVCARLVFARLIMSQ